MSVRRQTQLMPKPPQWALAAGLPPPGNGEDFCEYATRLGYSCSELLTGLTQQTLPVAHIRLTNKLIQSLPAAWEQHLQAFVKAHARPKPVPQRKPVPFRP